MRRIAVVGALVVLLAACDSGSASKPTHDEKVHRAQTVSQALLGITPDLSLVDTVSCSLDGKPAVRGYTAAIMKQNLGSADRALRQLVTIDLISCPESRWDELTDSWTATGIFDRATVAAVVLKGVAAAQKP